MFNSLWNWLQGVVAKMFNISTLQQTLGKDIMNSSVYTSAMSEAIRRWRAMYSNVPEYAKEGNTPLNLPAAIAGEIARMVTIEAKAEITGSSRADFLDEELGNIMDFLRIQLEYGVALGSLIIKPFVDGDMDLCVNYVPADMFIPLSYSPKGELTTCAFIDQRKNGQYWYTRFEVHKMENGGCTITNLAFRSDTQQSAGTEVSLTSVPKWENLPPTAFVANIDKPLFGYFRFPLANNLDSTSPLGVSCFSRAEGVIQRADEIANNLFWEFESGKRAVYIDELMFEKDTATNKPKIPDRRLYRTLRSQNTKEDFYKEWSPEFREAAINNGLNSVLRKVEYDCGLHYGTLSDPEVQARTATELNISRQRTATMVKDTQKALEDCLEDVLYAMDIYATLYTLAPAGKYNVNFTWDDSIITDKEAQVIQDTGAVNLGAMSRVEWRMRTYNEDEETAKKKIGMVQDENKQRVAGKVNIIRQSVDNPVMSTDNMLMNQAGTNGE